MIKNRLATYLPKRKIINISMLEAMHHAAFAVYYPFSTLFLKSKGYPNTAIGMIIAVNSLIVIFAQPFWGIISDKLQSVKTVFIICLCTALVIMQPLPYTHTALLTGCLMALLTFFESPLTPLLDSWVIRITKSEGVFYGHVRFLGSLSYAIFSFFYGIIIGNHGTSIMFKIFAAGALINVFIATRIKTDAPVEPLKLKDLKIGRLLSNYKYVSFILFAIILFIPTRACFIFLPVIIESVSGTTSHIGMCSTAIALSEIPVFLLSKKLLAKHKPVKLIIFSAFFFTLRMVFFSVASSPIHIILIFLLHGMSFSLFLTGTLYYLDSIVPSELRSTSLTLANSVYMGISGILASYGGGYVIDRFGVHAIYFLGIFTGTISILFFILSMKIKHKSETTADRAENKGGFSL